MLLTYQFLTLRNNRTLKQLKLLDCFLLSILGIQVQFCMCLIYFSSLICSWWKSFHFSACWIFMKTSWRHCWSYRLTQMSRQFWRSMMVCGALWEMGYFGEVGRVSLSESRHLPMIPASQPDSLCQQQIDASRAQVTFFFFWVMRSRLGKLNCIQSTFHVFKLLLICKEILELALLQFKDYFNF